MSRRIVIEEPCDHDKMERHWYLSLSSGLEKECAGGSRTVLDPEEWVEKAARVLSVEICGMDETDDEGCMADHRSEARAVLESVLGEKETP